MIVAVGAMKSYTARNSKADFHQVETGAGAGISIILTVILWSPVVTL